MKRPRVHIDWILPLAIVAFAGPAVRYIESVFSASTRWAMLVLLVLVMLLRGRLHRGLSGPFGAALVVYLGWCMVTVMWSEAPGLSAAKGLALCAVSIGMLAAGHSWVERAGITNAMTYLAPLALIALLAGVIGGGSEGTMVPMGQIELYQGLSGNPNMLGSLLMMSSPFLLWRMYSRWGNLRERWFWAATLTAVLVLLGLAYSRSAMFGLLCIVMAFLLALPLRHRVRVVASFVLAAIVLVVAKPDLVEQATVRYVYKGSTEEGILYTRERVWEESLELAQEGGLTGGGYGVTIGGGSFQGGLTAAGYGREKGNSQLAIWEETGLVGLALYALVIATLFWELFRGIRCTHDRGDRVVLALLTGALTGMTAMSVFEAWWVAPGSPEAAWFWATAGVALGVGRQVRMKARLPRASPDAFRNRQWRVAIPRAPSAK